MSDVTQLLKAIEAGEPKATDQLLPLVYEELRKLAAVRMANEKAGQTLQPTALVHEAWLKIAGDGNEHFANRLHFFKAAATAMQQILIDNARRKQRLKHGANQAGHELHESRIAMTVPSEELLAVNDALAALAVEDPQAAEVVQMRYFVGMTVPEIAAALQMAPRTVDRHWAFARAWLKRTIRASRTVRKLDPRRVFTEGLTSLTLRLAFVQESGLDSGWALGHDFSKKRACVVNNLPQVVRPFCRRACVKSED